MNLRSRLFCAAVALAACGGPQPTAAPPGDTQGDTKDAAALPDAAADAGSVPSVLKWVAYPSNSAARMRAIAADPSHPGTYWMAGTSAHLWRLAGTELSDLSPTNIGTSNLRTVWVAADGEVFAAGEGNALLRGNGSGDWTLAEELPASPAVQFAGISGASGKDVWAVGEQAATWHWDGSAWLPQTVSITEAVDGAALAPDARFSCVFVRGKDDVWIGGGPSVSGGGVVLHGTGGGVWQAWPVAQIPAALWASEPVAALGAKSRVFVVSGSASDYVAVFDGKAFVKQDKMQWPQGFSGVAGVNADLAWAVAAKGQVRKYDHGTWSVDTLASPVGTKPSEEIKVNSIDFGGLAALGADERAIVADFGVYRWGLQPK